MRLIGGVSWSLAVAILVGIGVGGMSEVLSNKHDVVLLGFVGGTCLALGVMLYQWGRKRFDL